MSIAGHAARVQELFQGGRKDAVCVGGMLGLQKRISGYRRDAAEHKAGAAHLMSLRTSEGPLSGRASKLVLHFLELGVVCEGSL